MFFDVADCNFEISVRFFERKSRKIIKRALCMTAIFLPSYQSPWQCLMYPLFSIDVFKHGKVVSIQLTNKCLKPYQSCGKGAKMIDAYSHD